MSLLLVCILIFLTTVTGYAVEPAESPYEALLQKGFTAEYLDSFTEQMIFEMYNVIQDNEVAYFQSETVFLTEGNDGIQLQGMISQNSLKLEITAAAICRKNTNIITGVLVVITGEWSTGKPFYRRDDAVTVNWDPSLFTFIEDSFYAQECGRGDTDDEWICENEYTRPAEYVQGGLGYYTKLSGTYFTAGFSSMFIIEPRISMIAGESKNTAINVNYVHDRSLWPLTIGFSVNGYSVGFEITGDGFDKAADTCNFRYNLG